MNTVFESLNSDDYGQQYKILKEIGKAKKKEIEWAVKSIAQKELMKIGASITYITTELWIDEFAKDCPEITKAVLSLLVEAPKGAPSVSVLYDTDKLEDAFIEKTTAVFMKSSWVRQMLMNSVSEPILPSTEKSTTPLEATPETPSTVPSNEQIAAATE